jgi:ribonuclease P protein component
MMHKSQRIRRSDFAQLLYRPHIISSALFVCKWKTSPQQQESRFAVVVSQQIYKKAVDRNKLRRQLYEAIRTNIQHIPSSLNIIIIAKKQTKDHSYQELESQLIPLLSHLHE